MILTKTIKTDKTEILVLGGLPEDAHNFRMHNGNLYYDCLFAPEPFDIPPGKWQPLGFLKDITEDLAKEIVDDCPYYAKCWKKYNISTEIDYGDCPDGDFDKDYSCWTAAESLYSLVEANVKLENKYGKMPNCADYILDNIKDAVHFTSDFREWQAEEETVFHNPYLLKKID